MFPAPSRRPSSGVSQMNGRSANSGRWRRRRNPSSPIAPSPTCSCRSRPEPSSPFESLQWTTRRRARPIASSKAARVSSTPSPVPEVVPGAEGVAGVEADAEAARAGAPLEDAGDRGEVGPDAVLLAGRVLDEEGHARRRGAHDPVERGDHPRLAGPVPAPRWWPRWVTTNGMPRAAARSSLVREREHGPLVPARPSATRGSAGRACGRPPAPSRMQPAPRGTRRRPRQRAASRPSRAGCARRSGTCRSRFPAARSTDFAIDPAIETWTPTLTIPHRGAGSGIRISMVSFGNS